MLRASAPATVSALATATGYSRPTVTEILSELAACASFHALRSAFIFSATSDTIVTGAAAVVSCT